MEEDEFVKPKEALLRREFYMLWVSRLLSFNKKVIMKIFPLDVMIVTSLPQVLRQHDHSVSSWVLQSFWPELHCRRSLSLTRWRSQQYL